MAGEMPIDPTDLQQTVKPDPRVGPIDLYGEFDPGSGRTLAACLTHASRAVNLFGGDQRRTGE
jgi:hypothetical protein